MLTIYTALPPVLGAKTAKALATGLSVHTVNDLLHHYPRRYARRGELTDLSDLPEDEQVTVVAQVSSVSNRPMRHRKGTMLEVHVTDGRGQLKLTFFNQPFRQRDLKVGAHGLFAGKVSKFRGESQLTHPDYQMIGAGPTLDVNAFTDEIIPVYPASAAMSSWSIAKSVRIVLDGLTLLPDHVPAEVRERCGLVGLGDALRAIHRPRSMEDVRRARNRLRFDEAFLLQVVLAQRRVAARGLPATPRVAVEGGLLDAFDARLPFALTAGQREVAAALAADMAQEHPMHRLLQGEVGSGKTVVALRAMLTVVDSGGQAALLAPTEVLAQQHFRSITDLLGPLAGKDLLGDAESGTRVALLIGSQAAGPRRAARADVASGAAGIVIGTHALIQDAVDFDDLALVVVDEQHRFGVEQRDALRAKAAQPPHLLVMTATPIPRTVAMTVFGDLDVSTLTELPLGRAPIVTHVVPGEKPVFLERTWQRLREEVAAGHQAFVVCPRIGDAGDAQGAGGAGDDSADADPDDSYPDDSYRADFYRGDAYPDGALPGFNRPAARRPSLAVIDVAEMLAQGPLAGLRVQMLHGRMSPDAKDEVMRRFTVGEVDVLVATTVIEVGVDVPNATAMVVMDADRFGVSQLHQLRGRVGRGEATALCLLVTDLEPGSPARARLDAVASTIDGFELSRVDLEARREGDVLGASQSGRRSSLRLLRVIRDEALIEQARGEATDLVEAEPDLRSLPVLRSALDALLDEDRAEFLDKA